MVGSFWKIRLVSTQIFIPLLILERVSFPYPLDLSRLRITVTLSSRQFTGRIVEIFNLLFRRCSEISAIDGES